MIKGRLHIQIRQIHLSLEGSALSAFFYFITNSNQEASGQHCANVRAIQAFLLPPLDVPFYRAQNDFVLSLIDGVKCNGMVFPQIVQHARMHLGDDGVNKVDDGQLRVNRISLEIFSL